MKKQFGYRAAAAALLCLSLTLSCQKDSLEEATSPVEKGKAGTMTVSAVIPEGMEDVEKVSLSYLTSGGLGLGWQAGDAIRIIGDNNEVFTIQDGFTAHSAEFSGNRVSGNSFDVYYPSKYNETHFIQGRDYTGQTQAGNDDTAHLEYNALLCGVNSLENISFSADWASAHGGSFLQNGAILFWLQLPDAISTVSKVVLSADDEIFYSTNDSGSATATLSLNLSGVDVSADNHILRAYMMTSWQSVVTTAATTFTVDVYTGEAEYYRRSFQPGAMTIPGGRLNTIQLNNSGWTRYDNTKGAGTQNDPYKIEDLDDLKRMKSQLIQYQTVYFSLEADIDMASVENWTPLNNGDPDYDRYIDFEGNGHIISNLKCSGKPYASFFGVLHGACRNVGFVNADVSSTNAGGILAGYLGLRNPANEYNIGKVDNCFTTGSVSGGPVGGIVGYIGGHYGEDWGYVRNSYSAASVSASGVTGGVVGSLINKGEVSNCYSCGTVSSTGNFAGGVIGAKEGSSTAQVIANAAAWNPGVIGAYGKSLRTMYDNDTKAAWAGTGSFLCWEGTGIPVAYDAASTLWTSKTTAELQSAFTALEGWSSTLDNGYPVLEWMAARADCADISGHDAVPGIFESGAGTEGSPYVIARDFQLLNVNKTLAAATDDQAVYFVLDADIDMARMNWTSLNNGDPFRKLVSFDGQNHSLSHLTTNGKGNYQGGFFAILYGTLKNITFTDVSVSNSANPVGAVCAWAGANNTTIWAALNNVHVNGGSVSQTAAQPAGGIAGKTRNGTFTDCSAAVDITVGQVSTSSGEQGFGGIVGYAQNSSLTRCQWTGTINGRRLSGGVAGFANTGVTFTNCSSSGTISATSYSVGDNTVKGEGVGGITGYATASTVTNCSSTASVTGADGNIGGMVGMCGGNETTTVSLCHFTGSLSGKASVGGIIGYSEGLCNVNRCWTAITSMTSTGNAGGIVGSTGTGKASVIRNCYSTGAVYCNGQCAGGILGEMGTEAGVYNCYSTSTLDGQRVLGGIVGRAANMKWDVTVGSGNTVDACIAWNPHIICTDTRDATKAGGSGTIVGYTSVKNTLTNGRRKADIDYQPSDSDYAGHGVDQPDCDGTNWTKGTTAGTGKTYQCPYHGTAAASNATLSGVAASLGWDNTVWNLSGSRPLLIGNPEE